MQPSKKKKKLQESSGVASTSTTVLPQPRQTRAQAAAVSRPKRSNAAKSKVSNVSSSSVRCFIPPTLNIFVHHTEAVYHYGFCAIVLSLECDQKDIFQASVVNHILCYQRIVRVNFVYSTCALLKRKTH